SAREQHVLFCWCQGRDPGARESRGRVAGRCRALPRRATRHRRLSFRPSGRYTLELEAEARWRLQAVFDRGELDVLAGTGRRDRLEHSDARLVELVFVLGFEQRVLLRLEYVA